MQNTTNKSHNLRIHIISEEVFLCLFEDRPIAQFNFDYNDYGAKELIKALLQDGVSLIPELEKILNYLWLDELDDFEESPTENHIYNSLFRARESYKRLENAINNLKINNNECE